MTVFLFWCGLFIIAVDVVNFAAPRVSKRRRRSAQIMGVKPVQHLAGIGGGALLVIGSLLRNGWVQASSLVPLIVGAVIAHRALKKVDDPPPFLARARDRPANPLQTLRHPVRQARADLELLNFRRNRREFRDWQERRGLRPPKDESKSFDRDS